VYDKNNKTFHHYNSLNEVNNLKYFRPLLNKLFGFLEIKSKPGIIEHQTPQQNDGVSCGLFVIAITEFLVRRYQNNSSVMN
jgi:Ulp1 family protease